MCSPAICAVAFLRLFFFIGRETNIFDFNARSAGTEKTASTNGVDKRNLIDRYRLPTNTISTQPNVPRMMLMTNNNVLSTRTQIDQPRFGGAHTLAVCVLVPAYKISHFTSRVESGLSASRLKRQTNYGMENTTHNTHARTRTRTRTYTHARNCQVP